MMYKVTQIEFDFDDDYDEAWEDDPIPQEEIINGVLNTEWHVVDEDDLVDEITDRTGWCIKSISYEEVD